MNKEEFIKLTNTVYKVLEFFPEVDPLKNRAKEKALAILESLILMHETSGWLSFQKEKTKAQLLEDIDILLGYLWIGKAQGWLNAVNYLIVANEYDKLKAEFKLVMPVHRNAPIIIEQPEEVKAPSQSRPLEKLTARQGPPSGKLTARQRQIIEYLEKNAKAQVMDLQTILPSVTKRTIRRDLDELLGAGRIVREGDFNQVVYKIKGGT